jgi:hypothetical protein
VPPEAPDDDAIRNIGMNETSITAGAWTPTPTTTIASTAASE